MVSKTIYDILSTVPNYIIVIFLNPLLLYPQSAVSSQLQGCGVKVASLLPPELQSHDAIAELLETRVCHVTLCDLSCDFVCCVM